MMSVSVGFIIGIKNRIIEVIRQIIFRIEQANLDTPRIPQGGVEKLRSVGEGLALGIGSDADLYMNDLIAMDKELTVVDSNPNLSAEGREKERQAVLKKYWDRFEARAAKRNWGELEAQQAQLVPSGPDLKDVVTVLRLQEYRRLLYGWDKARVASTFMSLSKSLEDLDFCYACESAPKQAPLVSPEILEAGRLERIQAEKPYAWHLVEILQAVKDSYYDLLDRAEKAVIEAGYIRSDRSLSAFEMEQKRVQSLAMARWSDRMRRARSQTNVVERI